MLLRSNGSEHNNKRQGEFAEPMAARNVFSTSGDTSVSARMTAWPRGTPT